MQVADMNHHDFAVGRESEADANLLVKFFLREKQDHAATAKEGRPMFKDVDYIEIRTAGKRDALACRPATHADKQRFPRHYDAFKSRTEMPTEGTPLSEWPMIPRSQVEELSFLHIKTVEQLIGMSDNDAAQMRGGLTLKDKAKKFLEASDKTKLLAEKQQLQDRLADQDEQLATQSAQIAELKEMMFDLQNGKKAPEVKETLEPEPIVENTPEPETDVEATAEAEPVAEVEEAKETETKPRRRSRK